MCPATNVEIVDGPLDSRGQPIQIIELSNPFLTLKMLSLGATMWQLIPTGLTPEDSLCLFHEEPSDYLDNRPYFGSFVGPVANRISGSSFELEGTRYELQPSEGRHHLHGGPTGFSNQQWAVTPIDGGVRFEYHRPDGGGGYPGNLDVVAEWFLDDHTVRNLWTASSDTTTPVSPTNHAYWNLAGARPGSNSNVLDHRVEIPASRFVVLDDELIPTGAIEPVGSTDARSTPTIGDLVARNEPGIDQSYLLESAEPTRLVGPNGRSVAITTTLPAMQLYTGQYLTPEDTGGRFGPYSGVCLETQHLPDAVNQPDFESPLVDDQHPVNHSTTWVFEL